MKDKPRHCINVEFIGSDRFHIKDSITVDGYTYKARRKKHRLTRSIVSYEIQMDVARKEVA